MIGVLHLTDGQKIRVTGHQTDTLQETLGGTQLPVEFLDVVDVHGNHHKIKTECIVSFECREAQHRETQYGETYQGTELRET
jgi:hypothetical protein